MKRDSTNGVQRRRRIKNLIRKSAISIDKKYSRKYFCLLLIIDSPALDKNGDLMAGR